MPTNIKTGTWNSEPQNIESAGGGNDEVWNRYAQSFLKNKNDRIELALEAHDTLLHYGQKTVKRDEIEKKYSLEGLNSGGSEDPSRTIKSL